MNKTANLTEGILGIDLGTTNCVVSYINSEGEVDAIPNLDGDLITPTFIHLEHTPEGKVKTVVGKKAKELAKTDPDNVISSFKTLMGTPTVIKDYGINKVTALTGSFIMLKYLKTTAEKYLGKNISSAVISVPAYFSEPQIDATRVAAKKAGLDPKRILIEPTAGAFYYGINSKVEEKVVAVYDLGGGTFDISIISIVDDTSTVMGPPNGDNKLGGDDIDREIAKYVISQNKKSKIPKTDMKKLIRDCELAKIELCNNITTGKEPVVTIDCADVKLKPVELTKEAFEQIIKPLVDHTIDCFAQALTDAGITSAELDEVVLVGGSSRIPYIRERLSQFLDQAKFTPQYFNTYSVDPDLAVGLGCGVFVKYLAENKENNITDVISKTIGIEDEYGNMEPLIRKGKSLPAKASKVFTNASDNQTSVVIKVFEGEEKLAVRNAFLSKVSIPISPAPKNTQKILVSACMTRDGVLKVSAISGAASGSIKIERQFDVNEDTSWIGGESGCNNVKDF